MSPIFDKDKDKEKKDKPPAEEERRESKLVSSYNLTYEQIKKQELGEGTEEKKPAAPAAEAAPETKKKPVGRF
jgi:hypothetical protein